MKNCDSHHIAAGFDCVVCVWIGVIMKSSRMGFRNAVISAVCVVISAFAVENLWAQSSSTTASNNEELPALIRSMKGPDLYRTYCASCHGLDAKGDGPAAASLKAKVPDLTLLAERNDGMFPAAKVRKVISGDDLVASHGSREMPIWGPIFHQVEEDVDRGNIRLENLVKYLDSIQSQTPKGR